MLARVLHRVRSLAYAASPAFRRRLSTALRPAATTSLVLGTATDLLRSRPELFAENALLRQQLIVLARSTRRPRISRSDRVLLVLLVSRLRAWRQALVVVQPATLLRWHRAGFRLIWRWRSAPRSREARVSPETVALIRRMAQENRLGGAERIRGEWAAPATGRAARAADLLARSVGAHPARPAARSDVLRPQLPPGEHAQGVRLPEVHHEVEALRGHAADLELVGALDRDHPRVPDR
jgi:hypothetical protein